MERDFRRLATTRGRGLVIFLFSPEIERKMKRCAPTGSLNRRAVCHENVQFIARLPLNQYLQILAVGNLHKWRKFFELHLERVAP